MALPILMEKNMPAMPRPETKAKNIAYKVMGVPPNIKHVKTPEERKIDHRLLYEETARVR